MNHFQTIRKIDQLAYNKATKEKEILFLLILIFKIYLKKTKKRIISIHLLHSYFRREEMKHDRSFDSWTIDERRGRNTDDRKHFR